VKPSSELLTSISVNCLAGGGLGIGFGPEQFATIPSGSFQMGATNGDADEMPVRTVAISKAFQLQRTEVTQAQWQEIMGNNPSYFQTCGPTCPVENVSWLDVQAFLTKLNQEYPSQGFRLPTEAEWEYAARAGSTGDFGGNGVLNDMGWWSGNSNGQPRAVAQKLANQWGMYDMHGNVWEWVADWYGTYPGTPQTDPTGPASGSLRVARGGSFDRLSSAARSASRQSDIPAGRMTFFGVPQGGFRLVRQP
jgi:formylglycine-generating enzyme required for sulfatase activity